MSPVCGSEFTPYGHGHPQKFCSKECKLDAWALKRAAELLSPLPVEGKVEILVALVDPNGIQSVTAGDNQGKASKKVYQCARWPYLRIGKKVKFENGCFETEDTEIQALIEAKPEYGAHIKRHGTGDT